MKKRKNKFAKREAEIIKAMEKGMRNREIATKLGINQKTISTYVKRIKDKVGLGKEANTYILVKTALPYLKEEKS